MASINDAIFYCEHYKAGSIANTNFFDESLPDAFNRPWAEKNFFSNFSRGLLRTNKF